MPELINDVDNRGRFIVRWATKCRRCNRATIQDNPSVPKDWEEGEVPDSNGRTPVRCPECRK